MNTPRIHGPAFAFALALVLPAVAWADCVTDCQNNCSKENWANCTYQCVQDCAKYYAPAVPDVPPPTPVKPSTGTAGGYSVNPSSGTTSGH